MTKATGECAWHTKSFLGPTCTIINEEEEEEEVSDYYRWKMYQIPSVLPSEGVPGSPACWKVELEILLAEDAEPKCDVITVEYTKDVAACGSEGADCQCAKTFKRGIFNNIEPPLDCKLCVSPLRKSRPKVCGNDCVVPLPTEMLFTFSDDGDPEVVGGMNGAEVPVYAVTDDNDEPICLGSIGGIGSPLFTTMAYETDAPEGFGDLEGDPEQPSTTRAGWNLDSGTGGTLQVATVAGGSVIAGWISEEIPLCGSAGALVFPITLTGSTLGFPSTITVTKPEQAKATSSGHVGGNCGTPAEPSCTEGPCTLLSGTVGEGPPLWHQTGEDCNGEDCHCTGVNETYNACGGGETYVEGCGLASEHVGETCEVDCEDGGLPDFVPDETSCAGVAKLWMFLDTGAGEFWTPIATIIGGEQAPLSCADLCLGIGSCGSFPAPITVGDEIVGDTEVVACTA